MGEPYHAHQFCGSKRRLVETRDKLQYIPLIKTLCQLMKDPTIREQVEQSSSRVSNTQHMEDFCDGKSTIYFPLTHSILW